MDGMGIANAPAPNRNPGPKEVVMESITEQRFVDRLLQALATLPQHEPRGAERCAQDWARAARTESVPVFPGNH